MHNFAPPRPKLMHQMPDDKWRWVQVNRLCKLACAAFCRSDFAPRPWFIANDDSHALMMQVSTTQHLQLWQNRLIAKMGAGPNLNCRLGRDSKHENNITRSVPTHLVSVRGDRWRSHCVLHWAWCCLLLHVC